MSRDMSKPYTEEEFAELRKKFIAKESYNAEDDTIRTSDFPEFCVVDMGYYRTPEQIKALTDYWDNNKGGKIDWDTYVKYISKLTSNLGEYYAVYVKECDKDGNGFISVDEFEEIHKFVAGFDKKFNDLTFDSFLAEADSNHDGKVSTQECVDWILKTTEGMEREA